MQKVLEIRNFALSLHSQLGGNLGCIVQKNAEIAQLVEHNLAKVGVASSGQPLEKIYADGDRDFWMTSQEALEYGMIDEILTRKK